MKLLILAILSGLGCVGQTAQTAASCVYLVEVKPDDPFQYTMAFLESMSYAKSAFRPSTNPSARADSLTDLSDLIYRIKSSDLDYRCAADLLGGYRKSKDTPTALSAINTVLIYQSMIEMNEETVVLLKRMASDGTDKISPGDLAEKMADLRLRRRESWNGLPIAVVGITHALVSSEPDSNGKMSSLRISSQQRRAIIQKLEKNFGPAVKNGVKEDQDPILASAAWLYAWISNNGWKNSDSR